jgi:FkbM family methyltransferase
MTGELSNMLVDHSKAELEKLLAEGENGARNREQTKFDEETGAGQRQLLLFGAGNLGRRTLHGLRRAGIQPVCFLDNDSRRSGTCVDELPVCSPQEGLQRFGPDCAVLVTIWGALGKDRMDARIRSLQELGYRHVYSFIALYWKFPDLFLPHYAIDLPHRVHQDAEKVKRAYQLLADERSREEFVAQLRFRLLGDFQALPDPVSGPIYFQQQLFSLRPDDVFVDCGAFDGDTLALYIQQSGEGFKSVVAFEPDPSNYEKLTILTNRYPREIRERIQLYNAATGESNSKVAMSIGAGPSSQVGAGDFVVDCFALDSVLHSPAPTIIKMDIEGSEIATLKGAQQIIRNSSPVLALSAYHRQTDLWTLPLLVHDMNPDYSFYLRPHDLEGWDVVYYAIPSGRV